MSQPPPDTSENAVTKLPDNFRGWMEANQDCIERAKSLPYFIRDSEGLVIGEARISDVAIGGNVPADLNSQEQKMWIENEHNVSDRLHVKQGEPMTHDEANETRPNPNYVEGEKIGYNDNCQSCVVAYEMRRRGYDVEAMMRIKGDPTNVPELLAKRTQSAWIDIKTGKEPTKCKCGGSYDVDRRGRILYKKIARINKELDEATKEPGRYHIDWQWEKGKEGHIIVAERFENGGLRLYDPQTGKI